MEAAWHGAGPPLALLHPLVEPCKLPPRCNMCLLLSRVHLRWCLSRFLSHWKPLAPVQFQIGSLARAGTGWASPGLTWVSVIL